MPRGRSKLERVIASLLIALNITWTLVMFLDRLNSMPNGKEDGRHRATASKELGIKKVPVTDFRKIKKASGGAVPIRLPVNKENPEAYFRRLIEWSFAVSPLFYRQHRADGGSVQDIEAAIRAADEASKKRSKPRNRRKRRS